jgi:uncharacterized glyoxalase superfamily protein PhnB
MCSAELLYGGEGAFFSSLQASDADSAILNLEQGEPVNGWGRLIFHVADVAEKPRNASWGERYFHICDPDGHELSFARPLRLRA